MKLLILEVILKIFNEQINREVDLELLFKKYNISVSCEEVIALYSHHSRYYHTFNHIVTLIKDIAIDDDRLILAVVFHDVIYGANIENHEEQSANFFNENCGYDQEFKDEVMNIILATKNVKPANEKLEAEIIKVDRKVLNAIDINTLINWENNIFKEFQSLSIDEYKSGRTAFLNYAFEETGNTVLLELRDIIVNKVYKVGFYPGSFNPFHIGHYNILLKAEKCFDKVIIGVGINFDKLGIKKVALAKTISNREIVFYTGLITTELEKLNKQSDVFIVRGLRNAYDLQHEEGLRNVIKDFLPDQEFVYFFCNKEYEHISSSLIRDIQSRNDGNDLSADIIKRYCLD